MKIFLLLSILLSNALAMEDQQEYQPLTAFGDTVKQRTATSHTVVGQKPELHLEGEEDIPPLQDVVITYPDNVTHMETQTMESNWDFVLRKYGDLREILNKFKPKVKTFLSHPQTQVTAAASLCAAVIFGAGIGIGSTIHANCD